MPPRRRIVTAAGLLLAVLVGCGTPSSPGSAGAPSGRAAESNPAGDIPDDQAFVPYSPASGLFALTVPEGWARTGEDTATTFTDKLNSVRVETLAAASGPDVASAQATEVPAIAAAAPHYVAGDVTTVTRTAGLAVLITYSADGPPDPVTGRTVMDAVERYEFWRAGQEVVLTLSGPTGADNGDPWRRITDSFAWSG